MSELIPIQIAFHAGQDDSHNPRTLPFGTGIRCWDIDLRRGRFDPRPDPAKVWMKPSENPVKQELSFKKPCNLLAVVPSSTGDVLLLAESTRTGADCGRLLVAKNLSFETDRSSEPGSIQVDSVQPVQDRDYNDDIWVQDFEPMEIARFGDRVFIPNCGAATTTRGTAAAATYEIDLRDMKGKATTWPKSRRIANYMGYVVLGDMYDDGPRWIQSSDRPLVAGDPTWGTYANEMPGDPDDRVMKLVYFKACLYVFLRRQVWRMRWSPPRWMQDQVLDVGTLAPETVKVIGPYIYFLGHDGIPYRMSGEPHIAERLGAFDYEGKMKHLDGRCPVEDGLRNYKLKSSILTASGSFRWESESRFGDDECTKTNTVVKNGAVELDKFEEYLTYCDAASGYVDEYPPVPHKSQLDEHDRLVQIFLLHQPGAASSEEHAYQSGSKYDHGGFSRKVRCELWHKGDASINNIVVTVQLLAATDYHTVDLDQTPLKTVTYVVSSNDIMWTQRGVDFEFDDTELPGAGTDGTKHYAWRMFHSGLPTNNDLRIQGGFKDVTPWYPTLWGKTWPIGSFPHGSYFSPYFHVTVAGYEMNGTIILRSDRQVTLPVPANDRWHIVTYREDVPTNTTNAVSIGGTGQTLFIRVPSSGVSINSLWVKPGGAPDSLRWMAALSHAAGYYTVTPKLYSVALHYLSAPTENDHPSATHWDGRYCLNLRRASEDVRDTYVWDREAWSVWRALGINKADVAYDSKQRPRLVYADIADILNPLGHAAVCALLQDSRLPWRGSNQQFQTGDILVAQTWAGQIDDIVVEYTELGASGTLYLAFQMDDGIWQTHNIPLSGTAGNRVSILEPPAREGRILRVIVGADKTGGGSSNTQAPVIVDRIVLTSRVIGPRYKR